MLCSLILCSVSCKMYHAKSSALLFPAGYDGCSQIRLASEEDVILVRL